MALSNPYVLLALGKSSFALLMLVPMVDELPNPLPTGKWELKATYPEGKSTCPRQPDSTFFKS